MPRVDAIKGFSCRGKWYLPDKPENAIAGTLSFSFGDGARLRLDDAFVRALETFTDSDIASTPEVLLGVSSEGDPITLQRCLRTNVNKYGSSYFVHVVFIGAHFATEAEIQFSDLCVHYRFADQWANVRAFEFDWHLDSNRLRIDYQRPDPIPAGTAQGFDLQVSFSVHYPTLSMVQTEATVKQAALVRFRAPSTTYFREFMRAVHDVENFLSLATTEQSYPTEMTGSSEANVQRLPSGKAYHPAITILYQPARMSTKEVELIPPEMLFTLSDLEGSLPRVLSTWIDRSRLLNPIMDLYFSSLHNEGAYIEQRFLGLVQALESYHRRTIRNCELPTEEHEQIVMRVLDSAPADCRGWLEGKLAHSNEPRLYKRLRELQRMYCTVLGHSSGQIDSFAHRVSRLRNYLTHYDDGSGIEPPNGEDLYQLMQTLRLLLDMCMLSELGFPLDKMEKLVSRNWKYRQLVRLK
ncbi:MAG: ApeA N-terminal domain 1-containing protein [Chloroflexota bacterium]